MWTAVNLLQMRPLTGMGEWGGLAAAAMVLLATAAAQERIAGGRQALRAMPGSNQQRWVNALKLFIQSPLPTVKTPVKIPTQGQWRCQRGISKRDRKKTRKPVKKWIQSHTEPRPHAQARAGPQTQPHPGAHSLPPTKPHSRRRPHTRT